MSGTFVLIIGILGFGIMAMLMMYAFYRIIKNFQPSSGKIREDLFKMKKEIQPWVDELIPWEKENTELLSLNQLNKSVKKSFGLLTVKGIFTSIYQEPMVAYSYKKYVSSQMNAVLYARTAHHEFAYRILPRGTQISIDNQIIGTIDIHHRLYSARSNQLLAEIKQDNTLVLPILVGNKDLGSLVRPSGEHSPSTRAFDMLSEMKKEEEAVLLSLAILEMVKNELPKG